MGEYWPLPNPTMVGIPNRKGKPKGMYWCDRCHFNCMFIETLQKHIGENH